VRQYLNSVIAVHVTKQRGDVARRRRADVPARREEEVND
jgi:hypothetical protein